MKRLLMLMMLVISLALAVPGTQAAPAGHAAPSVIHDYIVTLTPQGLTVLAYLRISSELVPEVYRQIDSDTNGQTSDGEQNAWYYRHANRLTLALDGTEVHPQVSTPPTIRRDDLFVSPAHPLVVTYTWASPVQLAGKHRIQVTYGDNYLSYDEYYISVAGDLANDSRPRSIAQPKYPATYQVVYQMPGPGEAAQAAVGQLAPAPWTTGGAQPAPAAPQNAPPVGQAAPAAPNAAPAPVVPPPTNSPIAPILDSLRSWRGEVWSGLGLLLLALALGALHALTPGHSKAMVAAYLVGSRGRVGDAVLLGGVVTVTHTIGVIALGLALWLLSNFSLPRALQPALELASGLLVVGLGLYLLLSRWRALHRQAAPAVAAARATQPVLVGATAGSLPGGGLPVRRVAAAIALAPDPHSHDHDHDHVHPHDHDHDQDHDHAHDPNHADEHTHRHGGPAHTHGPVAGSDWRSLVGLGISGGLVPCPDALAILLLAVSVGQIALGLGLVVAFSVGLAAVLIGIGIALVTMKGVLERRGTALTANPLWTRWVPLVSAVVVTVVGLLMILSALSAQWS